MQHVTEQIHGTNPCCFEENPREKSEHLILLVIEEDEHVYYGIRGTKLKYMGLEKVLHGLLEKQ